IGIHLRYDTMWYVLTDRSVRIRRGLWVLHETTITFENVQNVTVTQGPLERWFGIASVMVDTAGGGAVHGKQQAGSTHRGVIQGITNAPQVRELIMARARASNSAGLGDDHPSERGIASNGASAPRWTRAHVAALQAIRDELRAMSAARA
ncbi:MAG: PH domain-containing protein, partial [Phycisphaerae bacterium]|nr:PH domain-containing protein [Phycisphaerae bacterium]